MRSRLAAFVGSGWLLLVACGGDPPPAGRAEAPGSAKPRPTGNQPPKLVDVRLEPRSPRPGERVTARAEVRDPEGDATTIAYHWRIAGREVPGHAATILVEGARRGDAIQVAAVARDGSGESATVHAYGDVANLPPRVLEVEMQPASDLRADLDVTARPRATDPERDPLDFHYRWRVNGRDVGVHSETLGAAHYARGDRVEVEVIASDGYDASAPLRSPVLDVLNAPPRITSGPGALGEDGVLRHALEAEDPDGDRVRYRLLEGPDGMRVSESTGRLVWAPDPAQAGRHEVEIAVEDAFGARATQRFPIEVPAEAQGRTAVEPAPPTAEDEAHATADVGPHAPAEAEPQAAPERTAEPGPSPAAHEPLE